MDISLNDFTVATIKNFTLTGQSKALYYNAQSLAIQQCQAYLKNLALTDSTFILDPRIDSYMASLIETFNSNAIG